MHNGIDTIFFDVGNTLLFPNRQVILAPLHQQGIHPPLEQLHAIERRTKREFDELQQHGHADHGFWFLYYSHLLDDLGIANTELRDRMVVATRISANWGDMRPGTREALDRMAQRYHIGVISNADGKIAELLRSFGIADCFASITDSGLVGHEKPHPAIFDAALAAMQTEAQQCMYLGDVYSVDYLGATRAGMQAVLFDVSGAYRETGLPRVESLVEFEQHLSEL